MNHLLIIIIISLHTIVATAQTAVNPSDVRILQEYEVPPKGEKLGEFSTFEYSAIKLKCNYEARIKEAKEKAASMGGNLFKITTLSPASKFSQAGVNAVYNMCWEIEGRIYYVKAEDTIDNTPYTNPDMPSNADYALIYVYRPIDIINTAKTYKLNFDNRYLCDVASNTYQVFKIKKEGPNYFWVSTPKASYKIPINIKQGESYYLRCTTNLSNGDIGFQLIDNKTGQKEYEYNDPIAIKKRNKQRRANNRNTQ
jgi:hypothetical protein